jgi:hypothetical protein
MNLVGNQIFAIADGNSLTTFNDLAVNPVVVTYPAFQAPNIPANNIGFTWTAYPGIPYNIKYDIQVARDATFTSKIVDSTTFNGTAGTGLLTDPVAGTLYVYSAANASAFLPGSTYYYRVRVANTGGAPVVSKWSVTTPFTITLPSDVNPGINAPGRISPDNGAIGVSTSPALTWGSVAGVSSYEIVIATDSAFANVVDTKAGLTSTVYTPAVALKPGTLYFWQVRAINGVTPGAWVASAFTTATTSTGPVPTVTAPAPTITVNAPTPVVTVNVPTPQVTTIPGTSGTPAWAWVVIVIGAVLVIAVIVLIVRTRRV